MIQAFELLRLLSMHFEPFELQGMLHMLRLRLLLVLPDFPKDQRIQAILLAFYLVQLVLILQTFDLDKLLDIHRLSIQVRRFLVYA